jgi:hypothetical protein
VPDEVRDQVLLFGPLDRQRARDVDERTRVALGEGEVYRGVGALILHAHGVVVVREAGRDRAVGDLLGDDVLVPEALDAGVLHVREPLSSGVLALDDPHRGDERFERAVRRSPAHRSLQRVGVRELGDLRRDVRRREFVRVVRDAPGPPGDPDPRVVGPAEARRNRVDRFVGERVVGVVVRDVAERTRVDGPEHVGLG